MAVTMPSTPVDVHNFTWSAALLALLNLLIGGVIVGVIKQWPRLKELAIGAKQVTERSNSDRITQLEAKVDKAVNLAHTAEMKLVYAISAVQLLAAKVRADNPDDPTLKQAMELLKAATTGGMPGFVAPLMEGLHSIKGLNE